MSYLLYVPSAIGLLYSAYMFGKAAGIKESSDSWYKAWKDTLR